MGLMFGGVSARGLILDGQSVSLYIGGSPPVKVWPTKEVVQITLGSGMESRTQLWAALDERGLNSQTVTEIPFDIEFVGSGSTVMMFDGFLSLTSAPDMNTAQVTDMTAMFYGCASLTSASAMDTSSVTSMESMFHDCAALTYVPDMDVSNLTNAMGMFYSCASLTDGNVRLIGKHPNVVTMGMLIGSGLTREPFYDTNGNPI